MGKRMGRPLKPDGEKVITRSIRFPPALWQELLDLVSAGHCGKVLNWALQRELDRLKRMAAQKGVSVADLVQTQVRHEQRQRQIERLKARQSEDSTT